MTESTSPTAAVLLIGNELLSGKTQDANLQFLAKELAALGIRLTEARVVRDDHATIAGHLNALRAANTYVFTTGGIGPTHDDITAESIALAFGVEIELNEEAVERLKAIRSDLNEARLRMARLPVGSVLIDNPLSNAPGFRVDNVYVLAGVPSIARSMFGTIAQQLEQGAAIQSKAIDVDLKEGDFAAALTDIADRHPDVEIGSYPFSRDGRYGASIVVRGTDRGAIDAVADEVFRTMDGLGGKPLYPG